jgi:hypothetical protein
MTKLPYLKLKTPTKQLLGSLLSDITLPNGVKGRLAFYMTPSATGLDRQPLVNYTQPGPCFQL